MDNRIISNQGRLGVNSSQLRSTPFNNSDGPSDLYERAQGQWLQTRLNDRVATDPRAFRESLELAMGPRADRQAINALIDAAVAGDLPMPKVRFVDASSLGAGAQGAYDPRGGGTILLDRSLLADPVAMERVFIEEAGHHFDALFGEGDASGDEGALFARSMLGENLSTADILALRSENDHGSVMLDGRLVDVEFNYDEVGIDTPSTNTSNNNSSNNGSQSDNDHDDKPTKSQTSQTSGSTYDEVGIDTPSTDNSTSGTESDNDHDDDNITNRGETTTSGGSTYDEVGIDVTSIRLGTSNEEHGYDEVGIDVPAPAEGPPPTEDEDLITSSGAVRPTTIGGGFFGWLFNSIYRPIATGLTGLATTTGAVAGSIVGGFIALVYPRPAGEGSDITPDTPNVMNVRVDDDTGSGEIYADGEPTGINVEPTGIDENGIPTGYTPATDADAEALSELTGTQISVGDTIGTGTPDAEGIKSEENGARRIETGNSQINDVLEGSTPSDAGNRGWETPQTQEEFEENIRNIPGADVQTHRGGGINATLPDGTEISTYPARGSTGHPGWQVESPEGVTTHKGSLTGQS